jgi:hypothetical protein
MIMKRLNRRNNKMKKILIIFSALLLFGFGTDALAVKNITGTTSGGDFTKVGAAGAQFMKIGIGPRAAGMAGAYGAVADDLTSVFWNPAGLANVNSIQATFNYTSWFAGFDHNFGAIALPIGDNFTAALHMASFGSDRIEITTIDNPDGLGTYYSVADIALGLTFSGYLTDQFSFGITAKYISNTFASMGADGVAFDFGTMYETGIQGIRLGFSIHNLGPEQQYEGEDLRTSKKIWEDLDAAPLDATYITTPFALPLIFRAGIAADIVEMDEHKLIGSFDFLTLSDTPEQFALGLEYTWNDLLSVRGGYLLGHDQFNLAGGVGINYFTGSFMGQLDYSISPTSDIGLVHRIGISIGMD